MRINNGSGRGRSVDAESQFVKYFVAEIPAVLDTEVLIARSVKGWKSRHVSSRWCPDIRDQSGAVINDVPSEHRMCVGKVVIDPDHAVVFVRVTLVCGD